MFITDGSAKHGKSVSLVRTLSQMCVSYNKDRTFPEFNHIFLVLVLEIRTKTIYINYYE